MKKESGFTQHSVVRRAGILRRASAVTCQMPTSGPPGCRCSTSGLLDRNPGPPCPRCECYRLVSTNTAGRALKSAARLMSVGHDSCLPRHGEILRSSLISSSKLRLLSKTEAEFHIRGPHRRKVGEFEGIAGKKLNAWSPNAVRPIQSHGSRPCLPIQVPSFRTHREYEVKMVTALRDIQTHERGCLLA